MAEVKDIMTLSREHMNEFATRNGVEKPEEAKNKEELAGKISPVVTPEKLAEFKTEMGYESTSPDTSKDGDHSDGDKTPEVTGDTPVVTPNSAPPAEGEAQIVDKSAPADDNIEEIKSGEREEAPEAEAVTTQPGDPKVKTNEGGVIVERDATKEELDKVDTSGEPEHITEAQKREEANDFGGDHGQIDPEADVPEDEKVVKLKNPSGRVVDVRIKDIAHQKMFAAGFETVEGEEYPAEVTDLEDAYKNNLQARTIYNDVDQSDPHQSKAKGDVERRKGSKETGDSDGEPQAKIAAPKNADKPQVFDGVDKRENGQVVNPKTSNPLKSNRLSQALNQ